MADMNKGGVTVKVITGKRANGLLDYADSLTEGQTEGYLFSATRHCSLDVALQKAEWRALREAHRTQGAVKSARATHERCDERGYVDGERGTHVQYWDGKRNRKRPVREGETPTHLRVEAAPSQVERQNEVVHTIYAFGADMANPDDPEQCRRAFDAVVAHAEETTPGLQEKIWGERNGESGLFHVHRASNATIYSDFELDGVEYRAGRKMAGALTSKDDVRARFENYLDAHPEHGMEQSLARVGTPQYEAAQISSSQKDYRDKREQRQEVGVHEQIRRAVRGDDGLAQSGPASSDFILQMPNAGVEVKEVGLRRAKPTKSHDYSYRLLKTSGTASPWVRGKTLGPDFTFDAITDKQQQLANGTAISWHEKQTAGPPRDVATVSAEEISELQALAKTGREQQAIAAAQAEADAFIRDWAAEEDETVEEFWGRRGRTGTTAEDKELAAHYKAVWDAQRTGQPLPEPPAFLAPPTKSTVNNPVSTPKSGPVAPLPLAPETPTAVVDEVRDHGDLPTAPPLGPRSKRQVRLSTEQRQRLEGLVIVQETDGPIYVEAEIREGHLPSDSRLSLLAARKQRSDREVLLTKTQMRSEQLEAIKDAAGDNRVELPDGRTAYAVQFDVRHGLGHALGGYVVDYGSVRPSAREPIDADVMRKQQVAEESSRAEQHERLINASMDAPSGDIDYGNDRQME